MLLILSNLHGMLPSNARLRKCPKSPRNLPKTPWPWQEKTVNGGWVVSGWLSIHLFSVVLEPVAWSTGHQKKNNRQTKQQSYSHAPPARFANDYGTNGKWGSNQ